MRKSKKRERDDSASQAYHEETGASAPKRARPSASDIDVIYGKMQASIEAVDRLLWDYIPLLLEEPPEGSKPKEVLDFYDKDEKINENRVRNDCIVKCRIKGVGKRYLDLTEIKDQDERIKIIENLKIIHCPSPSRRNRRLDSLARLLEGEHTCVAVFQKEKSNKKNGNLFITANNIHEKTRPETYQLIVDIMEYLKDHNTHDRKEIFERICLAQIKRMDKSGIKISNSAIKRIANYVLLHPNWKKSTVEDLLKIAADNIRGVNTAEQADILRVFLVIGNLSKDLRKIERTFKGKEFEILLEGKDGLHAELRMVNSLLKRGEISLDKKSQYIGISRLCCPKCELVIKTINFTMKEMEKVKGDVIETRGGHGIKSKKGKRKRYQGPDFLDDKQIELFPLEMQEDIREIGKYHHLFSVFLNPTPQDAASYHESYTKVCKILDLMEGKAVRLVKKKYDFKDTIESEGNIIEIEQVLKDKQAFLLDTSHDFLSLKIQGKQKYLNLKDLRDANKNFNEVYRDLFVIHDSLVKEENKQANQRASQSSSEEELEGIVALLDNVISQLQQYRSVDTEITWEIFIQTIEQEFCIKLGDLPSKDYSSEDYVKIVKNAKKDVEKLKEEIDTDQLIKIINENYAEYNALSYSSEEENIKDISSAYSFFDDPRKYNDNDITDYNGWVIRNKLGGFKSSSGGSALPCRFLLQNKFADKGYEGEECFIAVIDAIDTAGASLPINYFFDKSLQIKNAIPIALMDIIIPVLDKIARNDDDLLRKQLKEYLIGANYVEEFRENIFNKLKEVDFNRERLQEIIQEAERQFQARDVFEELIPVMLEADNCYAKIIFPYNRTNDHWLSGEIKIAKNDSTYTIEVYAHDPYGGGQMTESNFNTIKKTLEKRIRAEDPNAFLICVNKISPYGRRQIAGDAVSCGIITAEDIIKLVYCQSLNVEKPYEYGAFSLRESHCKAFNSDQEEALIKQKRFIQRFNAAKSIGSQPKTLAAIMHQSENSEDKLSLEEQSQSAKLISTFKNQELKNRIIDAITDVDSYEAKDGSYLILVRTAIEETPILLKSQGTEIDEEDVEAINQIHRIFFNKCIDANAIYEVGAILVPSPLRRDFDGSKKSNSARYLWRPGMFSSSPQDVVMSSTECITDKDQLEQQGNIVQTEKIPSEIITKMQEQIAVAHEFIFLQGQFYSFLTRVNYLLQEKEFSSSQREEIELAYKQLQNAYQRAQELGKKMNADAVILKELDTKNFDQSFILMGQVYKQIEERVKEFFRKSENKATSDKRPKL